MPRRERTGLRNRGVNASTIHSPRARTNAAVDPLRGRPSAHLTRPRRIPTMLAVAAPYVAVVILHWGAVEVTARCLQSIARAAFPGRRTILVIDNTGRM